MNLIVKWFIGRITKKLQFTCLILFLLFIGIVFRNFSNYFYPKQNNLLPALLQNIEYHGIIDAGSTGSRLYMYKISKGIITDLDYMTFPNGKIVSHKITPGLADFANNSYAAVDYLASLIKWFENSVESHIIDKTTISILATAGMRLLPYQQKVDIIERLKLELPKKVKSKIIKIKIISGKMEGVYQWVANNYLQGKMNGHKKSFVSKGIIELGGASLQIVYEKQKNNYYNQVFTFYNYTMNQNFQYKLHSESLLGYGFQSVYQWFFSSENTFLTNKQKETCLPKNCFKVFLDNNLLHNFTGTGDILNCIKNVENSFIQSGKIIKSYKNRLYFPNLEAIKRKSFTLTNSNTIFFKMHPKMQFDAFSEFYYASNDFFKFQMPFNSQNNHIYIDQVIKFCQTDFSLTKYKFTSGLFNTTLEENIVSQCFKSAYIMLINKVISAKGNFITPRNKFNNKEVQWTFGSAIDFLSNFGK